MLSLSLLIEEFWYPKYGPGQLWELTGEKIKEKGGSILFEHSVKKINKKDFENEFEDFWNRYPNKFNKPQTYKNFVKTAKSYGAETVLRALNNYLEEIKQKNTAKEYITRSTNFVGQKAVFLGYLESETKTEKFHNLDSDDLIKKLKQEGGFE